MTTARLTDQCSIKAPATFTQSTKDTSSNRSTHLEQKREEESSSSSHRWIILHQSESTILQMDPLTRCDPISWWEWRTRWVAFFYSWTQVINDSENAIQFRTTPKTECFRNDEHCCQCLSNIVDDWARHDREQSKQMLINSLQWLRQQSTEKSQYSLDEWSCSHHGSWWSSRSKSRHWCKLKSSQSQHQDRSFQREKKTYRSTESRTRWTRRNAEPSVDVERRDSHPQSKEERSTTRNQPPLTTHRPLRRLNDPPMLFSLHFFKPTWSTWSDGIFVDENPVSTGIVRKTRIDIEDASIVQLRGQRKIPTVHR